MAVKLTLLPMLASAAVAAQPASEDEPPPLLPPGATAPLLLPPGLTPAIDECQADPGDAPCPIDDEPPIDDESPVTDYDSYAHGVFGGHHRVFRGGFGHYFWAASS